MRQYHNRTRVHALSKPQMFPRCRDRSYVLWTMFAILCFANTLASADENLDAEIAQVITKLEDQDPQVRLEAFMAIRGEYGSRATAAIPTLIELLKAAPDNQAHLQTRKALAAIGPAAESALLELLRSDNATWRERAVMSLLYMSIGPRKPLSAVPELVIATTDEEYTVRRYSVETLGKIGPESKHVVPAITSALKDKDATVRHAAVRALAGIGPAASSATSSLLGLLQHDDISTRAIAVFALGRIGQDARAATRELIQLLKDDILQEEASVALRRIGVTGEDVPALIEVLTHDLVRSRQLATLHLARVGPNAKPAVAALVASLEDEQMREFAIHAIGHLGYAAKPAVPELIKFLADDSYYIRAGTAEALGRIGPDAIGALPMLEAAANDVNALARRHAQQAICKIMAR